MLAIVHVVLVRLVADLDVRLDRRWLLRHGAVAALATLALEVFETELFGNDLGQLFAGDVLRWDGRDRPWVHVPL